jgi:hypothetical protein
MNFNNATLLGLTKTSEFLADTVRYRSTKNLTIEGLLLDLTNDDGSSGIINDLLTFQQDLKYNWQDVVLNNISFGSGIVNNVKFSEGNDVRTKTYTAEIVIPQSGDFLTLSSGFYSGLNFNNFEYIQSFSESSDFTRDVARDTYNQQVNITINNPSSLDAISAAKTIAQNFFDKNNLTGTIGNYSNYPSTKKYYTEEYDQINGSFKFTQNFELYKDSNGLFSLSRTHKINFDQEGVLSITESAEYIGNTDTAFDTVNAQAKSDISNAYSRCNTIFSNYTFGGDRSLVDKAVSKSWNTTPFEGTLNYDIEFTNQLRLGTSFNAFHDYSTTFTESEGGLYSFSQDGNIVGYGDLNTQSEKYSNAQSSFIYIKNNLIVLPVGYGTFRNISTSETHSEIAGKIDYAFEYTNNSSISSGPAIRRTVATISRDYNRFLSSNFNIIGYKEVVQIQRNKLENNYNYSITMNGKADTDISTYLSNATAIVAANPPSSPYYLSDVSYSYDPFSRQFTFNLTYFSLP